MKDAKVAKQAIADMIPKADMRNEGWVTVVLLGMVRSCMYQHVNEVIEALWILRARAVCARLGSLLCRSLPPFVLVPARSLFEDLKFMTSRLTSTFSTNCLRVGYSL